MEEGGIRKESEGTMQEWSEMLGRYKKGAMSQGRWVTSRSATPILFGTRYWFCERQIFHGPRWGGGGLGMILTRSLQPRSFSCTVFSRVPTPTRIYCCHWSDRRWNSGANERDGRACKYRWSSACPLATHLLLCGPVPHRPWTGTGL